MAEAGAAGSGIAAVRGLTGKLGTASSHALAAQRALQDAITQIAQARKHFAEFGALAEVSTEASDAQASLAALEEAAATTATLVSRCAGDSGGASEEQTVDVRLLPNADGTATVSIVPVVRVN